MVEIKITGETPMEALSSLTAFGLRCLCDPDVSAAAHRILQHERTKEAAAAAPKTPPTDASAVPENYPTEVPRDEPATEPKAELSPEPYVEEPPHGDPKPASEPTPAPGAQGEPVPIYTIEQIREKGTAAARTHGNRAVKAILSELGASGMTALKKEQYPTFLKKLAVLDEEGDTDA